MLSTLPFVELDFSDNAQKRIYDRVVEASKEIYSINENLKMRIPKRVAIQLLAKKDSLVSEIQSLIERVYHLDF